jgi:hypothetical protein
MGTPSESSGVELFKHAWHSPLGLAKLRGAAATLEQTVAMALANEGTSMGTFQYMASEQLEGKDAGDCTDTCSFGSVFYEMTIPTEWSAKRS